MKAAGDLIPGGFFMPVVWSGTKTRAKVSFH